MQDGFLATHGVGHNRVVRTWRGNGDSMRDSMRTAALLLVLVVVVLQGKKNDLQHKAKWSRMNL